jgi:hypothetical protein
VPVDLGTGADADAGGRIEEDEQPALGGLDRRTLFVTGLGSLFSVKVAVAGAKTFYLAPPAASKPVWDAQLREIGRFERGSSRSQEKSESSRSPSDTASIHRY